MIFITGNKKNLGARYFSNVIDYTIYFLLATIVTVTLGEQDSSGSYRMSGFKTLLIPLLWILYFPVTESLAGFTLGKKAFDLHVVGFKGDLASFGQCFTRRLLDIVELAFLGVPAVVSINHTEKSQRLGDMMANTRVVRTTAVCRFCNEPIEISTKEVIMDTFVCPSCHIEN